MAIRRGETYAVGRPKKPLDSPSPRFRQTPRTSVITLSFGTILAIIFGSTTCLPKPHARRQRPPNLFGRHAPTSENTPAPPSLGLSSPLFRRARWTPGEKTRPWPALSRPCQPTRPRRSTATTWHRIGDRATRSAIRSGEALGRLWILTDPALYRADRGAAPPGPSPMAASAAWPNGPLRASRSKRASGRGPQEVRQRICISTAGRPFLLPPPHLYSKVSSQYLSE